MGETKQREGVYTPFRNACKLRDTNISAVLNAVGRADSNTGSWRNGAFPRLDIAMDIAEYLGISLDELCYGIQNSKTLILDDNQKEWLSIIQRIPKDKHEMLKDFLRTHAVIPDKYENEDKKIS